jgi:hypothetical protein
MSHVLLLPPLLLVLLRTGRSLTLLDPTYASRFVPIIASVSEHQPPSWPSYITDLHFAALLAPAGIIAAFRKLDNGGDVGEGGGVEPSRGGGQPFWGNGRGKVSRLAATAGTHLWGPTWGACLAGLHSNLHFAALLTGRHHCRIPQA